MASPSQSIGVIGAGTIFQSHAKAYSALGRKMAVIADLDKDRGAKAASAFDVSRSTTDWRNVVDDPEVGIVDICTPPKFHTDIAIAALQSDKHVICEKPLAPTLEEIDRIAEAEQASSGKLLVVHQLRFQPLALRYRWLLDQGHLGDVTFARTLRYDPPPQKLVDNRTWGAWELTGGGVLMTKAIHQLDLLCWLLGPPTRVQAMMGTFHHDIESEDHVVANIQFRSGALASASVNGAPFGYTEHMDLVGSAGMVSRPWRLRLARRSEEAALLEELDKRYPISEASKSKKKKSKLGRMFQKVIPSKPQPKVQKPSAHLPLFEAFFQALQDDAPSPVPIKEGRTAVELCTAIYASALGGGINIDLPLDDTTAFYRGVSKSDYNCLCT